MSPVRRKRTVRAGVFVLVGGGLVVAGLAVVAGVAILRRYDHYVIYFRETVSGLSPGSPVKLRGVEVGRVEDIEIDPENVELVKVKIRVRHRTPITKSAKAKLREAGITGLRYIEIEGGKQGEERLEPGSVIPSEPSTLYQITGRAEAIAFKAEKLLNNALVLTSPGNREQLWGLVVDARRALAAVARLAERLDVTVEVLEPRLAGTLDETQRSLRELRRSARSVRHLAENLDGRVASLTTEAKKTLAELRMATGSRGDLGRAIRRAETTMERLEATLAGRRMDENLRRLGRALDAMNGASQELRRLLLKVSRDLRPTLRSIRSAAERLEEFARTIQENPAAILRPSTGRRR